MAYVDIGQRLRETGDDIRSALITPVLTRIEAAKMKRLQDKEERELLEKEVQQAHIKAAAEKINDPFLKDILLSSGKVSDVAAVVNMRTGQQKANIAAGQLGVARGNLTLKINKYQDDKDLVTKVITGMAGDIGTMLKDSLPGIAQGGEEGKTAMANYTKAYQALAGTEATDKTERVPGSIQGLAESFTGLDKNRVLAATKLHIVPVLKAYSPEKIAQLGATTEEIYSKMYNLKEPTNKSALLKTPTTPYAMKLWILNNMAGKEDNALGEIIETDYKIPPEIVNQITSTTDKDKLADLLKSDDLPNSVRELASSTLKNLFTVELMPDKERKQFLEFISKPSEKFEPDLLLKK